MTSREDSLLKRGVCIEEDPDRITSLPDHEQGLKDLLLNFKKIVPITRKLEINSVCHAENPVPEEIYCDSRHKSYEARYQAAHELRDKVCHLDVRDFEYRWQGIYAGFVFNDINDQASEEGIHMRDLLCWGSDELFTNAVSIRRKSSHDDAGAWNPKPDFWFGLHLYEDKHLSRLKGLETTDKGIHYFTPQFLDTLSDDQGALIYQPVKSKKHEAFPWMVAELKKKDGDTKKCLEQAANGCYTCLKLGERLAVHMDKKTLPIIAFTTDGPKVKFFISYCDTRDEKKVYRMSCIWAGNIQNMLHAIQLRRIVDQLMFWALRIFKPWVTECLHHWYELKNKKNKPARTKSGAIAGITRRVTSNLGSMIKKPISRKNERRDQSSGAQKSKTAVSEKASKFSIKSKRERSKKAENRAEARIVSEPEDDSGSDGSEW